MRYLTSRPDLGGGMHVAWDTPDTLRSFGLGWPEFVKVVEAGGC